MKTGETRPQQGCWLSYSRVRRGATQTRLLLVSVPFVTAPTGSPRSTVCAPRQGRAPAVAGLPWATLRGCQVSLESHSQAGQGMESPETLGVSGTTQQTTGLTGPEGRGQGESHRKHRTASHGRFGMYKPSLQDLEPDGREALAQVATTPLWSISQRGQPPGYMHCTSLPERQAHHKPHDQSPLLWSTPPLHLRSPLTLAPAPGTEAQHQLPSQDAPWRGPPGMGTLWSPGHGDLSCLGPDAF